MNSVKNVLRARAAVAHKLELDNNTLKSLKRMHAGTRPKSGLMATLEEIRKVERRVSVYRAQINAYNFCLEDAVETTGPSKAASTVIEATDAPITIKVATSPSKVTLRPGKVPFLHATDYIAHRDNGKNVSIQGTIRNLVTNGYGAGKTYTASDILADLRRMEVITAGVQGGANAAHTAIRKLTKTGTIAKQGTNGILVTIQPAA